MKVIWSASAGRGAFDWQAVNDGVMGGLSRSAMKPADDGTSIFAGEVSLENNGGFASVRTPVPDLDLSACAGIRIRVLGDGKRYSLRLRTDRAFDGIVYRQSFATTPGAWMEIDLPFSEFEPSFRGQPVSDAGPLDIGAIRQMGLLIGDGQAGPFRLQVAWIAAYADA